MNKLWTIGFSPEISEIRLISINYDEFEKIRIHSGPAGFFVWYGVWNISPYISMLEYVILNTKNQTQNTLVKSLFF